MKKIKKLNLKVLWHKKFETITKPLFLLELGVFPCVHIQSGYKRIFSWVIV
jgi:hypothetical protein